ncbi:MAG TPA: hypothetical protein PKZ76_16160 [Xanthomonadaceae bacterium]|nr:hypothetical protein [Xanthomonadaceae bacterium]
MRGHNLTIDAPAGKRLVINGTGNSPVFRLAVTGNRTFSLANAIQRQVEVQADGDGGRVTSVPVGNDCPGICGEEFPSGTALLLVAEAAPGNQFLGWSGDCVGTAGPTCEIFLSGDASVSAGFGATPPLRRLTVSLAGTSAGQVIADAGGIACPDQFDHDYLDGTHLVLDATPGPNSDFAGWGPPSRNRRMRTADGQRHSA